MAPRPGSDRPATARPDARRAATSGARIPGIVDGLAVVPDEIGPRLRTLRRERPGPVRPKTGSRRRRAARRRGRARKPAASTDLIAERRAALAARACAGGIPDVVTRSERVQIERWLRQAPSRQALATAAYLYGFALSDHYREPFDRAGSTRSASAGAAAAKSMRRRCRRSSASSPSWSGWGSSRRWKTTESVPTRTRARTTGLDPCLAASASAPFCSRPCHCRGRNGRRSGASATSRPNELRPE